ncbi:MULTISPECIES: AEC family transporter [Paenibacillus]|uniref:AEC family transporter n=2 Tax=Paenibacillus TaxID=44249 RepID=A0ABU6D961_9BACL|nr:MULTISPECIES: AEC family transporter [Paenibacillus]MBA2944129.1 AEC family transporter [Paenibacillus sp. CGMCC 1.16610]MCY9661189.1 AEC family transporter [Paenibacillus anseongense]MEB4793461.1 AEC family transporter [Paenibacillus chondroitinus]MVQ38019.1 AEC family transporter [Paenibacillus anseongense]
MSYFIYILINNIVPISIMIAIGAVMYRAFHLDIKTLSKLNFYVFSPAIVFVKLYESEMNLNVILQVLLFFALFFSLLFAVIEIYIRIKKMKRGMRIAMRNSVIFYNSANYALPLNQTVFGGNAYTLSIQIIIMIMQNLIPNTYGIYTLNAHKSTWKATMKTILSLPVIYAIPVALLLRYFHLPVPSSIHLPLTYISNAFMATALLTLGVQLGGMKWEFHFSNVAVSNILRLIAGPLLGFLVVWMLGINGLTAQALVLSCAVPTSLSSVLLAIEYENEPEFSSQAVFTSTLFSMFTIPVVIYFTGFL